MIKKIPLILSSLIITGYLAVAQVEEKIVPTDLKQQTVITEPITLYKGFFRAGLSGTYSVVDKYFTDEGRKESFANNIWATTWFVQPIFQYGITDRIQVELYLPYRIQKIFQSFRYQDLYAGIDSVIAWDVRGNGLSDISFSAGYQILKGNISAPAIAGFLTFTAPTGSKNPSDIVDERNYSLPNGSGEASIDLDLKLRQARFPYAYSAYLGYKLFFGGNKIFYPGEAATDFKSGNYFNIGGSFDFHLNEWIALQNGLDCFLYGKDEVDGLKEDTSKWILQYFPRLTFQLKRLRLAQAVTVPLKGKSAGADISYFLVIQYMF
jgi:hypothetical protein